MNALLDMDLTSSDLDPASEPGQGSCLKRAKMSCEKNPFLNELIVHNLMRYLDFPTLLNSRLVCKAWCTQSFSWIQQRSLIKFEEPDHETRKYWTGEFDSKKPQFLYYSKCFKKGTLPYETPTFLFQNFKFINYHQNTDEGEAYPHNDILGFMRHNCMSSGISSLYFEDLDRTGHQVLRSQRRYPSWGSLLEASPNLKTLSFDRMPEREIYKFFEAFDELDYPSCQPRWIRTLCIRPKVSTESLFTEPVYPGEQIEYKYVLAKALSVLSNLQELTLISNFSAEQLMQILKGCNQRLKSLNLGRLTPTPNTIIIEQPSQTSVFFLPFPALTNLRIPNVYLRSFEELNQNCPNLKGLTLTLQPIIVNYGMDTEINYVEDVVGTNLDFSTNYGNENRCKNPNLTHLEWQVDPHMVPALTLAHMSLEEVQESVFFGLGQFYPNIQVLKAFVGSSEGLKNIWNHFSRLNEVIIATESSYASQDDDFDDPGLDNLTFLEVQSLRLLNDNSRLTEKSFRNFAKFPKLRTVEIRRAPNLSHSFGPVLKTDSKSGHSLEIHILND